jgi:hypothetical protein
MFGKQWSPDDENFPRAVVEFLSPYLRDQVPFEIAWDQAMQHVKPRERGWKMGEGYKDGPAPLAFLKHHCQLHYEARQRELRGEPGLVPTIALVAA